MTVSMGKAKFSLNGMALPRILGFRVWSAIGVNVF
jgi:hypothetical protein